MKRYLAILVLLPLLAMGGRQQGMGPGPGMPASAGGGGYTDNFPGSSLSGNWTCYSGTGYGAPIVGSAQVQNNHSSQGSLCGYTGTFSASLSQATFGALASYVYWQAVCVNLNVSAGNGYCAGGNGGEGILKFTTGASANIGSYCGSAVAVGDVFKIQNVGGTITETNVTQSWSCSATDSTYTGGVSGFFFGYLDTTTRNAWSTWSGS
jgi:hypothetical protein